MFETYGDRVAFLVVYIREAHALDSFLPKGAADVDPIVEDPASLFERQHVAQQCLAALELESLPTVVDTLDDAASRAYDAWPDRLYLIDRDGKVAYQGGAGPDGFVPSELEEAIDAELEHPGRLAGRGVEPVPVLSAVRAPNAPVDVGATYACGDWTFNAADADDYHSRLYRWWKLSGAHFQTYSTLSRQTSLRALRVMDSCWSDLVRFYGGVPKRPLGPVIMLRSLEQYNAFAIQRPDGERVPPEIGGFSAVHYGFPCERWVEVLPSKSVYPGASCAYWDDRAEASDAWGAFAARHAAGHAFAEAFDPVSAAVARSLEQDPHGPFDSAAFWREKSLPLWLRYGVAVYVERYFRDDSASDPLWARRWSLSALDRQGGLSTDLADVFTFVPSPAEVGRSQRWLLEVGALIAFVLDGGEDSVGHSHASLQEALQRVRGPGRGVRDAVRALRLALVAAGPELRAFVRGE